MRMAIVELVAEYLFTCVCYVGCGAVVKETDTISILGVGMVLLLETILFFLRKRSKNIVVFLMGTLLATVGAVYFSLSIYFLPVAGFLMVFRCCYSMAVRCVGSLRDYLPPHILPLGVMVVCYVGLDLLGKDVTKDAIFWCTFCYLLLFMYAMMEANMEGFLSERRRTTIMDEAQIKRVNRKVTMTYVSVAAAGMLMVSLFSYDGIYKILYQGLRFLLQHLFTGNETEPITETQQEAPATFLPLEGETNGEWPWMRYLEKVMYFVGIIGVLVLLGLFVYTVMRALYRGFYKKMDLDTEKLQETKEIRQRLKKNRKRKLVFKSPKDDRARIRTLYKKAMAGFWKESSVNPEATTPEEQWKLKDEMMDERVVNLYEKARYSREEIIKEDVEHMKQWCKRE